MSAKEDDSKDKKTDTEAKAEEEVKVVEPVTTVEDGM